MFYEPGHQYNLTGSSENAVLGKAFTWTCGMFIPAGQTENAVIFYRNGVACGSIGLIPTCKMYANPKYTYGYLSEFSYTLTIPAEKMTEYEQGSVWRCEYIFRGRFKSRDVTLHFAGKLHHLFGLFFIFFICSKHNIFVFLTQAFDHFIYNSALHLRRI